MAKKAKKTKNKAKKSKKKSAKPGEMSWLARVWTYGLASGPKK